MVSRREQLGSDDKAIEAGKNADEEEDRDFNPEEIQPEDIAEGKVPEKPKPKGKGKGKAKSKAKAKSKPEATTPKPKRAAKAKASPGKKKRAAEAAVKDCQDRAKRQCKTLPAEIKEPEIEVVKTKDPEETEVEKVEKPTQARKSRRTSNASTAGQSSSEDGADQDGKDDDSAQAASFASRYMPKDEVKASRFRAIRDVFVRTVASKLKSQSRYQERGCSK